MMVVSLFALVLVAISLNAPQGQAQGPGNDESRVKEGFAIAPVHLNLRGKNRALVGLGSYIVNAQASCSDCHTCPTYTPGHNPYDGIGDGQINGTNYLAGGVAFGPFITSANITPDSSGKPAGLDFDEFLHVLRTGQDPDNPGALLQVMPWPILRNMTDHDIRAIYEYLSSIPHADPGNCGGPGE
jgi:cytochrome c553